MSKYFDKDFFKFFIGFLAIVSLSLIIIIATRLYAESRAETASVINSVTP
jgi:predicted ferric reductase